MYITGEFQVKNKNILVLFLCISFVPVVTAQENYFGSKLIKRVQQVRDWYCFNIKGQTLGEALSHLKVIFTSIISKNTETKESDLFEMGLLSLREKYAMDAASTRLSSNEAPGNNIFGRLIKAERNPKQREQIEGLNLNYESLVEKRDLGKIEMGMENSLQEMQRRKVLIQGKQRTVGELSRQASEYWYYRYMFELFSGSEQGKQWKEFYEKRNALRQNKNIPSQ